MILYTPLISRGITLCPSLILIPEWARNDRSYEVHERQHGIQMEKIGTLKFWFKYLTNKEFRLEVEVEAYRTQILAGGNLEYCASELKNSYSLSLTFSKAIELLSIE